MSSRRLLNWAMIGFALFALPYTLFIDVYVVSALFNPIPSRGVPDQSAFLPMAVMSTVSLLFWLWLIWWRVPHQRSFDPAWRGVIRNTPRGPRVRLQPMYRMFTVWGVLQFACYFGHLAAFLIVMSNAESAELPAFRTLALVLAGLLWILGGCIAAAVWWWEPLVGVLQDDVNAGTLSWRNLGGKKKYQGAVVRQWVRRVTVQEGFPWRAHLTTRRVVLHWVNAGGEPMADTVAEYWNPADAEALARWLRERLGLGEGPHPPSPSP